MNCPNTWRLYYNRLHKNPYGKYSQVRIDLIVVINKIVQLPANKPLSFDVHEIINHYSTLFSLTVHRDCAIQILLTHRRYQQKPLWLTETFLNIFQNKGKHYSYTRQLWGCKSLLLLLLQKSFTKHCRTRPHNKLTMCLLP